MPLSSAARPLARVDSFSSSRQAVSAAGAPMLWLHRYAKVLACATLLLVAAGGMVTSTSAGLSVPDWPTTYGYPMFSFPLQQMVGGIFYEHGHRLIASTVGFLTIGLVVFLWMAEPRRWVRWLGVLALAAVIVQGVLGGLTVLFFLPPAISIAHAGLAQLFFGLTVTMALVTSPGWRHPALSSVDDGRLRRALVILASLVYVQILIGATMRHLGAGLAIPDFPLAFGHLVPPIWTAPIAIHFAHRTMALVVTIAVLLLAARIRRSYRDHPELARIAWLLLFALFMQVTLGALVVLSGKQPIVNTLHVATGAVVFATTIVLTLRAHRVHFA